MELTSHQKNPPLESKIVKATLIQLRSRGGWWFKVHGSPMQIAGIPDIIGCYHGRFIAFEVKRDATGRPTKLQAYTMQKIKEAGGIVRLIYTPDQALQVLQAVAARIELQKDRRGPSVLPEGVQALSQSRDESKAPPAEID
jgi:hypothetical protein